MTIDLSTKLASSFEHLGPVERRSTADRRHGTEIEPAGEHRQAVEQHPFIGRQEVLGPGHRGAQPAVALTPATARTQRAQAIVESFLVVAVVA
jgi:hypothetical protein